MGKKRAKANIQNVSSSLNSNGHSNPSYLREESIGEVSCISIASLKIQEDGDCVAFGSCESPSWHDKTQGITYDLECRNKVEFELLDLSVNSHEASNVVDKRLVEAEFKPQIKTTLIVSLCALSLGMVLGFSSPTIPELERKWILTDNDAKWYASVASLGSGVGSLIGGPLNDCIGRKTTLIVACFPAIIGWFLLVVSDNLPGLIAGRAITGLAVGIKITVGPFYIGETVSAELRGLMGAIYQIFIALGVTLTFFVSLFVDRYWLAVVCSAAILCMELLLTRIPETPRWLAKQGFVEEAKKSLQYLRGPHFDITKEINEITKSIQVQNELDRVSIKDFTKRQYYYPFSIVLILLLIQQLVGINAITLFLEKLLAEGGMTDFADVFSLILVFVSVASLVASCILQDKFSRRTLMIFSGFFTFFWGFTTGLYFFLLELDVLLGSRDNWIMAVGLTGALIGYQIGWGITVWIVVSEVLPMRGKGIWSAGAVSFSWFAAFLIGLLFLDVASAIGYYGLFWLFCGASLGGAIYVILFIPETKNHSLEDIERHFREGKGLRIEASRFDVYVDGANKDTESSEKDL